VGLLFCAAFVAISVFVGEQPNNDYVLIKAEKLVRTAGTPLPTNNLVYPSRRKAAPCASWSIGGLGGSAKGKLRHARRAQG
jgi:hypothetical protein